MAFSLSRSRQGGLIAMHPAPNVAIPFKQDDSCAFNRHVAKISSGSGFENHGNGFLDVAELAHLETRRINATGKTTIGWIIFEIFAVTYTIVSYSQL